MDPARRRHRCDVFGLCHVLAPLSTVASVIQILGSDGARIARHRGARQHPGDCLYLTFRPLIGDSLILVALAVGYFLWRWRKSAAAVQTATPAKAG